MRMIIVCICVYVGVGLDWAGTGEIERNYGLIVKFNWYRFIWELESKHGKTDRGDKNKNKNRTEEEKQKKKKQKDCKTEEKQC
jgi:hypothetical protein